MKYVYLSAKVQHRIEALKKSGKAGRQLARKVTRIIESLTSGTVNRHRAAAGSYTKYGENRIKNCHKYDLGCGYRLITLQRDSKIYIPFLGPHDDCQRWLENNSRMKAVSVGKGTWFQFSKKHGSFETEADRVPESLDEERENEPELKMNDNDLRRVFCGLVKGAEKQRCKS